MKRFIFIMLALVFAGCSSTTEVVNTPPEISFVFSKLAVPKGLDVDIEVTVSDADEDPLTVQWQASSGSLDPADQGKTVMTWSPPASVGTHTITATVSDGKASKSATVSLQTGTLEYTNITGGTTTWTNANSPYIISEAEPQKFRISGGKLVIGPGVTAYIDSPDMEINVVGVLEIVGTTSQPVIIKPNHRNPTPGYWLGIMVDIEGLQAGLVDLDYADISYAQYNIRADEYTDVDLTGCTISHGKDAGVFFRSEGQLTIQNCDISENDGTGLLMEKLSDTAEYLQVNVTNSTIRYNGLSGVDINLLPTVGETAFITFAHDSISFNNYHGINLKSGAYPTVFDCAIFFNDIFRVNNGFNIRVDPAFIGFKPSIDARNNFWGTSYVLQDSTEIAKLIYDKTDNPALPKVRFVPWCNTHPCP